MIVKSGVNGYGEQHWTLHIPNEHCVQGLEVGVVATAKGLVVGDGVISWADTRAIVRAAAAIGKAQA